MRILFLSPRQCWPPFTGARLREFYLAKALGRRAELTHVFFAQPDGPAPGPAELPFSHAIVTAPLPRLYTPSKIARGLLSRWPLPIVNYYSPAMAAALERLTEREPFDLIHLDSLHMGAYIPLLARRTSAPFVFDWHNIESELMQRYGAAAASPARKAYARFTARRLARFEQYALREGLGHAVCSERERDQLRLMRPSAQIAVIENGVDASAFGEPTGPSPERRRVVFVGSMNYQPNIDAAVSFARDVWPLARARRPEWTFTVVGSKPAPPVLALRGEPGVEVTGAVDDVRPYYREAVAAVVPLRSGGGTRLKILEAMAAGTPVVSTALGAEGLAVSPGANFLIAESVPEWLAQLDALAPQDELWQRIACAGWELARRRYDWAGIGERLYQTYACWLEAVKQ
jgi:glycosyltransferase involved in cell wall biosynthesis